MGLASHPKVGTLTLTDNVVREALKRVSYLKAEARSPVASAQGADRLIPEIVILLDGCFVSA